MELNERVKVLKAKDLVVLSYDEAVQWCLVWIEDWEVSRLNKDAPSGWEWIVGLKHCWLASSCDASERTITEITFNNAIGHEEIRVDQNRTAVRAEEKAALLDFGEPAEEFDPGSHYRYTYRQKVTAEDLERGYVDVKFDPYRVCDIYKIGGGPREHIVKKGLRGPDKGHTERELIGELQSCLDRWEEMLNEDEL